MDLPNPDSCFVFIAVHRADATRHISKAVPGLRLSLFYGYIFRRGQRSPSSWQGGVFRTISPMMCGLWQWRAQHVMILGWRRRCVKGRNGTDHSDENWSWCSKAISLHNSSPDLPSFIGTKQKAKVNHTAQPLLHLISDPRSRPEAAWQVFIWQTTIMIQYREHRWQGRRSYVNALCLAFAFTMQALTVHLPGIQCIPRQHMFGLVITKRNGWSRDLSNPHEWPFGPATKLWRRDDGDLTLVEALIRISRAMISRYGKIRYFGPSSSYSFKLVWASYVEQPTRSSDREAIDVYFVQSSKEIIIRAFHCRATLIPTVFKLPLLIKWSSWGFYFLEYSNRLRFFWALQ
jgi:hypothetical protein